METPMEEETGHDMETWISALVVSSGAVLNTVPATRVPILQVDLACYRGQIGCLVVWVGLGFRFWRRDMCVGW